MLDGIPLAGWTDLGAFGLLLVTIWMVFTGRLVPRRHHDEVVSRLLTEITTSHERVEKADRNESDSLALAQSMTEMNVELVKQKDAARAAVESVKALAERRAGEDP